MKNRGERHWKWGEGWLLAAALCLILALSLFVYAQRRPDVHAAAPVHAVDIEALRRAEMVDINAARADELAYLPGIGEGLAERIIAYRDENGPFSGLDELMNVDGIGEGKLAAIRDMAYAG